jgi:hypothetical protein
MESTGTPRELIASFTSRFSGDPPWQKAETHARGVGWVLQWASVVGVFFVASCFLVEFAYCLSAERTLARAARAGAVEATLPQATYRSVADIVRRHFAGNAELAAQSRIAVLHNGAPETGLFQPLGGDRMAVTITVPVCAVLPRWLGLLRLPRGNSHIKAHAGREVSGRSLRRTRIREF